jgi:PKD repeat protein
MRLHEKKRARVVRAVPLGWLVAASILGLLPSPQAWAGQRQFLVILANSPKQYPNPARVPRGQPGGGLPNRELIRQQYFDNDPNNNIGSFAEYWREISYGDVTISGDVTDWIDLPWAIQPPLLDSSRDVVGGNPPVGDNLESSTLRNSPANFFDLNGTGRYEYGASENFSNFFSTTPIDLDGNPNRNDDGPFFVSPGSQHQTFHGLPVWKPGERFVDMDGDGRWDGLDEANNQMDFFGAPNGGPDGKPDLLGPWVDLDGDGVPNNEGNCTYLRDSDNDGNPDCCPDGPGKPGCDGVKKDGTGTKACPPMRWKAPNNTTVTDCNGNLIDDAVEIALDPTLDRLPWSPQGTPPACVPGTGDGIPDACQYKSPVPILTGCVATVSSDPNDPCHNLPACVPLTANQVRTPVARCEYDDSNASTTPDIVEPYENFMRRWDPCLFDPEVSAPNAPPSPRAHWIKVYDPLSPLAHFQLQCFSPPYTAQYDDPSYIKDNYPAGPADQDELIAEATQRPIYGQHDPTGKLTATCKCRVPWADNGSVNCRTVTLPTTACTTPPCTLAGACLAGYHSQFDPPDAWTEVQMNNSPGNTVVRTSKMQAAPGVGGEAKFIDQITFEPGDPPYPETDPNQTKWYPQAWQDRYGDTCADPTDRTGQHTVTCQAPPWTKDFAGQGRTHLMRPFTDVDDVTVDGVAYDPLVNRRYFHANRGGLHGDGTGWVGCSSNVDGSIIFETGPLGIIGFQQACDHAILPEETRGASKPGVFFDGYVEHDDLPSSKYHMAGDQRLGEVTSPYNNSIFGQDRGTHTPFVPPTPDNIIAAAGPYALHVHGNLGRDAGNVLLMELLTWRTRPPFNNADAWQTNTVGAVQYHPYAFLENKGFRDFNLDGLVDEGESRYAGSENYQADSSTFTPNNGVNTDYPFNRDRMVEDAVAVNDDLENFNNFVDPVALAAVTCPGPPDLPACLPWQLSARGNLFGCDPVLANGILSGIVLLPAGAHADGDFNLSPQFLPIHNEANHDRAKKFPQNRDPATKQTVSWNLFFFNLVFSLGVSGERTVPAQDFQTAFAAHEYLHGWERFPDLYDYDVYATEPRPNINCPVGRWDIMSGGGLVHPVPILKGKPCTKWTSPVDLTTVVTPGVDTVITLPAAEFVRDNSYFFLENEARPGRFDNQGNFLTGERYYFWSAGQGFDERMPGEGMLILHTDEESNPDGQSGNQTNATRVTYLIVQADGLHELEAGQGVDPSCGDLGDAWPGSSGKRRFNFTTNPSATWYTQNSWTGIDVLDVQPDGTGAVQLKLNWVPTSVPTLKFIDPPGGVSVGLPPNVNYDIRTQTTDVYGGTWVRVFYTTTETDTPTPAIGTLIQLKRKTTPGTNELHFNWNLAGVADGRYFLFADLIPDQGADGGERQITTVRAGRNNLGTASLANADVTVDTSTIANGVVTHSGAARSETWTLRCVDATAGRWVVGSSLTQPLPPGEASTATCTANANLCATTGTLYTSLAGAVAFTIQAGAGASPKGAVGDTFTFTTTGITAPSAGVTIRNGQIREDPTAIIDASPLSGPPPLTVTFDARRSVDPNGQPLQFRWDFGDGATATGAQTSHPYTHAGDFTVTLRATNPANSRFGEASVDIQVTNNSPKAVIKATPTSGQGPLDVHFSATQSSDAETAADQLIYQWDYGDGVTANDQGTPGVLREPVHTYARRADGTLCTTAAPCNFTATLTVTDGGGKSDAASTIIRVGNTSPVATISTTALQGSSPLTVTFNAKNSTDAENDKLEVEWQWGDGTPNEKYPAKTGKPPATDGSVPHTFTLPANTTSKTYTVKAIVRDQDAAGNYKGGETPWSGVTVTVTAAATSDSDPRAIFCFQTPTDCVATSPTPAVGQSFTVDASRSFDNPLGGRISAYTWDWGDATPFASGATQTHSYSAAGTYTITLTVADGDSPPHTGRTQKSVVVTKEGGEPPPPSTNHPPSAIFVVSPPEALVGEAVNFDARSSSDPDGDALRYRWVFGDGNQTQFTTNPRTTHTYASAGSYLARLTVRDAANASTDATQTVRVLLQGENRTPVAMIATGPRAGTAPLTLTFDGRISFDPDGTAITYTWEFRQNGELVDTMTGAVVTRAFETPGDYTVELVVKDASGAEGRSEPQSILVTESSAPPPPEPPPPRPQPGEPPDSSGQRPTPTAMCGLGMLPGLLASLAGFTLTAMTRRRLRG